MLSNLTALTDRLPFGATGDRRAGGARRGARGPTPARLRSAVLAGAMIAALSGCAAVLGGDASNGDQVPEEPVYDDVPPLSEEVMEELERLGAGRVVFIMTVNEEGAIRPFRAPERTVRTFEPGDTIDDYREISVREGFAGRDLEVIAVEPQIVIIARGSNQVSYRCRTSGGRRVCYEYQ